VLEKLDRLEERLSEAERDIDAAHGGDADAAQRARRALLDVDGVMAEADLARKWPALEEKARDTTIYALGVLGLHGTDAERSLLAEVMAAIERARAERDAPELERQLALADRLATGAYQRTDEAWHAYFHSAASEVASASDLPRAHKLVTEGHAAIARGDTQELRRIVKAIFALLPESSEARKRGFDSGVR
jgi:molecular chaperone DnaK